MNRIDEIEMAITNHGLWKKRLQSAITTGQSMFQVESVSLDNGCDFGKWFYSLPPATRGTPAGQKIQTLHAQFHREAAQVLGMALAGKKAEAETLLETGQPYTAISGQLAIALTRWKDTIDNP